MQMTMIEALNSALTLELERDRRVVVFGQDIGANGGGFRVTERLQQKFGEQRAMCSRAGSTSPIATRCATSPRRCTRGSRPSTS